MAKKNSRVRPVSGADRLKFAGLTDAQAKRANAAFGLNALPESGRAGWLAQLVSIVRDPMILMLIILGGIYFVIGNSADGYIFSALTSFLIVITLIEKHKTEKALAALKSISAVKASVIRDGRRNVIDSRYLAPGDLVEIDEGGIIPADGYVLTEENILISEAILTGESAAVKKHAWDGKSKISSAGGNNSAFAYSGTTVLRGRALIKVAAIGKDTAIGRIGASLGRIKETPTLLESEIGRLIAWFAVYGLSLCLIVICLFGFLRQDWLDGVLSGLSLAMAILPEELSVILTVFLALGAWRLAKSKVLAKKGSAIETLGAVSTLCVDKTGTITFNKSELSLLSLPDGAIEIVGKSAQLPAGARQALFMALLACYEHTKDPMELAIREKAKAFKSAIGKFDKLKEYPLSKELLAMTNAWQAKDGSIVAAAKGAPEAIRELCRLSSRQAKAMERSIASLSAQGFRMLAVAGATHDGDSLPLDQRDFRFEYLGLLAFADPMRPNIARAVSESHQAGVRVVMITGDYPLTALRIAEQIGLNHSGGYLTGDQLRGMSRAELKRRIGQVDVFARVQPEQKLAIVEALMANGEIVAMTGDGVNDAPALKAAHIGIAMGERGTDVARETADIVLLNDDFSTIVRAIKLGRRIFDNIRKATAFVFSVHLPIAGMTIAPLLLGWPTFFLPIHIAFLELIIDPACSLVFESEEAEAGIMNRPPRPIGERLLNGATLFRSIIQGLGVFAAILACYSLILYSGRGVDEARTIAFFALVLSNLLLIISNLTYAAKLRQLSSEKNKPLLIVAGASILILLLAVFYPPLSGIFHFAAIGASDFALSMIAAAAVMVWLEGVKFIWPHKSLRLMAS